MNPEGVTSAELYRLLFILGGVVMGINALTIGVATVVSKLSASNRLSKQDAIEEGERRKELGTLAELARANQTRWEQHDKFVEGRMDELHRLEASVAGLATAQAGTKEDIVELRSEVRETSKAAREASQAITRLATGIVAQVRIGAPLGPPDSGQV